MKKEVIGREREVRERGTKGDGFRKKERYLTKKTLRYIDKGNICKNPIFTYGKKIEK